MLRLPPQHTAHATSCSNSNAIWHHSFKKRIELRTQEQPLVAKHIGGTIRAQNDPSRNRRTDEVAFIAGCSHFTRKNASFVLRLPPQHTAHATSCSNSNAIWHHSFKKRIELRTQEQPLVAKHIGGTIRAQNDPSRNRRTDEVAFIAGCSHFTRKNTKFRAPASSPTHSPCNIMQLFQCDLAPQLQETHRTTHTDTTTRCKTHRRNNPRTKRPQPQPSHTRGTFHRRLQPLYTEKHKVSCSGFLPNTQPMQHHAAIPMQSGNHGIQEPHRTTHTDTTTRCKTHRRNNSRTKRPQPQPPHRRGSFHRRLQPLYTEKRKVSCSRFLPNTQPMQHRAAITMRFAASRSKPAPIYARGNIK